MSAMRPFALFAILALASCGSKGGDEPAPAGAESAKTAAAGKTSDPCSLVTTDEVAAIIGEKVLSASAADGKCTYKTEDDASSPTIALDQQDAAGAMKVSKQAARVLGHLGEEAASEGAAGQDVNAMLNTPTTAPKLGDESFFGPSRELSILKGGSYLAISPPMMRNRMGPGNPMLSDEDAKAMAVAMGEKAVARLP